MKDLVADFVLMNTAGLVLQLCEKYYDENVLMLNNGVVFAKSMEESYEKQKRFIGSVKEFDVKLLSSKIEGNISELIFQYKMTGEDSEINEFTGKHIQTWKNGKIIREEYYPIERT
ncbi:MAG: hypothetical protein HN764_13745 [Gammaproteobacteria bacterium]|jgi:hypothetical protein|nr:hypothetical protein [Gammaproteobacteria bacterium]